MSYIKNNSIYKKTKIDETRIRQTIRKIKVSKRTDVVSQNIFNLLDLEAALDDELAVGVERSGCTELTHHERQHVLLRPAHPKQHKCRNYCKYWQNVKVKEKIRVEFTVHNYITIH